MSTPTLPLAQLLQGGSPSPTAGGDMGTVLRQTMQSLQGTPFGAAPSPTNAPIDAGVHPVLAKAIGAIADAAKAYGWTGMTGQERTERTQLEQQKAETMARLAQAGVTQEQTAQWREEQAETARSRAASYEENVQRQKERDKTQADIANARVDVQREMMEVRKSLGQGRLDVAHQQLEQRASQFEQMFQLRAKQVGIEQAKLELGEQANMIRQGFLDVARGALSQKGTVQGAEISQKLQEFQREHWIATSVFGFPDINQVVGESRGAGIPGVPAPTPTTGAQGVTRVPTKPPKPSGGATHTYVPGKGIQPIAQQP